MTFEIALLGERARLLLGICAVVCAIAALVLSRLSKSAIRHPRLEALGVAATVGAIGICAALAAERLVALAVAGATPDDVPFNEMRWVVGAPWGRFGITIGVAVAVLTLILGAAGLRRERLPRRALLTSLRAGACGAALILFLEPALELRHVTREPNHVAILVDDSRSMELAEKKGAPTRAARAAAAIAASAATFEKWRTDHVLDFFTFSDTLMPASEKQAATPAQGRADATLLREALESVRSRYDRRDLAGVVVLSDGTPTGRFAEGVADGVAQDFLAGLGVKVHTLWTGAAGLCDLAVAKVIADDFAFVRTAVKIEAVIRATGLGEREVPVTLKRDGQPVKEITARVGGRAGEARVVFEIVPDRVGKYVYEISVPVLPEEAVLANNTRAFVMRVTRDKTRVLQVAGRPSWDERALRAYFKADPNVDLISFFILRTHDDIQVVATDELSLIPFPTQELFEEELGSFDVIVLQDFALEQSYGISPYLDNLRDYAEKGGGLAMIGGSQSFSSGGYFDTPVAQALPVELAPEYLGPDRLLSTQEFAPKLTDDGARHPVTQLRFERRDNLSRWASLPPLEGVNLVTGVKPGATVLLVHPTLRLGNGPMPVVVAGEYGKGRTMAILTDSTWRWGFMAAGRDGDDGRAYAKLMDNTVRWLIKDPELDYLRVESDQAEYKKGQPARFHARLTDKDYKPAPAQEVTFEVVPAQAARPNEKRVAFFSKTAKTDELGAVAVEAPNLSPGSYRVVAKAKLGDRWVTADDVFVMNPERDELSHPEAREDVLSAISQATGGRYLGAASSLADDLAFEPPRVVRALRLRNLEIWSRPHLLALALLFLGAEWALRRRRGFL